MKKLPFLLTLFLVSMIACKPNQDQKKVSLQYPEAIKKDHVDTYHGTEVPDPYQWLEDDLSEETASWVNAQNEVTGSYLNGIGFREALKGRIEELMDYERVSAPFKEGQYEYFYKNDGLQNHSVLYRTKVGAVDAAPEVFLDPNTFSEDGTTGLRGVFFTKDGSLAAYMITEGGSDWRKVIVINAESKAVIGDTLIDVKFSGLSWRGNAGFYYSSYDNPKETSELSAKTQHHKLYYHELGTTQDKDVLVYGGEKQPNRYIGGGVSEDGRYLIVSAAQNTSGAQLYVKDLAKPSADFVQIHDDYFTTCDYVDNIGTTFYFYTNIDAPNYRLVKVDLNAPAQSNWVDVIPESENVLSVNSGGGKLFATYLVDAKTAVKQFDMDGKLEWEVALPGIGSASGFGAKKEDTYLYYSFTSFTYPSTIYKYDIASGESTMYKQSKVDFDPSAYETKQVFYESKDGTKVPMFIVYKKGLELNGKNPTYLYAYGGFNISLTPSFSASRIVWLENGGIYAQPNIRGGGEYGEKWHKAGTQMQKQNVFDDFIAAGEYLIKEGYTSSDYLAIAGGSNGGLLVGATMTQRPDLAKVALPAVGVLDMLKYHKFTSGAGWAADYGTAEDSPEMFAYLKGYSPYHNLKDGVSYPATMVTTADHDDRVVPAHSFKFASRLQAAHVGDNPVLIRIQTKAGHGSVSTKQSIELEADRYAFIWTNMGVEPDFSKAVPN
ncbi:MAG: prolyl oligopeptidase family serine peptidase [Saprospiraceae bacterium]